MRKTFILIACLAMVVFATTSFAGNQNNGTSGTLTISGTTGPGPNMTYEPSPNVGMAASTSATNYTLVTANSLTDTTNGIEYGIDNNNPAYWQKTKTTAAGSGPTATTSATDLPSGFTYMGSS